MLDAALELASLDWAVFPCIETPGERAKSPYTKNGFLDASTDPDQIHKWWNYKPGALIGLAVPAEILVIDIDPRNGGSRAALEKEAGPIPVTATAWSGRGDDGQHLYFMRPKGDLTGTRLPPGIDLKDANRGYVIVPPSLHPDTGQPYRWEHEDTIALVPFKLWQLLQLDLTHSGRHFSPREGDDFTELLRWVAATPEGARDDHVFYAACRMAEQGSLDGHEGDLIDAALSTGFSEREIRKCIASARRRVG
jgi:hypothetical protein